MTPAAAGHSPPETVVGGKKLLAQAVEPALEPEPVNLPAPLGLDLSVSSARFMDYYRHNLAGLMVWLDSEENDYRKRVVPLAEDQPAIGFAIMAFAAQHGAMTFPHENIATMAESARDRCLQLIQSRAQEMTTKVIQGFELNTHSDIADAEWMLASILIIGNYENARCCPGVADGHRRAARTIVNLFSHSVSAEGRELFAFLRNQLAIEDVLAATTSFDPSLIKNAITPVPGSDSLVFSKYLAFLHQVTLTATKAVEIDYCEESRESYLTLAVVQSELEQARGATLMAAGRLGLGSSKMTRDFVRLVEVYHNAGLLYSFHCLEISGRDSAEWMTAAGGLFDQLTGFEDQATSIQNLPWPAFIAGTVCHGDKQRQRTILSVFDAIHEATKFNHYLHAVDFLKTFWAGRDTDWRPLARLREASGQRIIVA
ncbi:hypothetical protein CkaCkLH20_12977 [Colletotrichum karsti]|uniref:Uncharacterized protein n=1 Tax=Colletotrichum karsti TaxID=1095194 RepID=A0A9P6HT00_9PEZI|nr:uncharacterized protein CkaCkLH20_12977 [Colletotrichum karsti]KAF9869584.1 hypothetical protein CkaCkLH20_12977 [Colletotrichum karsti]